MDNGLIAELNTITWPGVAALVVIAALGAWFVWVMWGRD